MHVDMLTLDRCLAHVINLVNIDIMAHIMRIAVTVIPLPNLATRSTLNQRLLIVYRVKSKSVYIIW